ncbi:MAG: type II secretion system F family protein [Candidatus Tectomicrobia bacterium]|nr:type II secretion system F family protein [Candidatus Tectomicrobia bacterium]
MANQEQRETSEGKGMAGKRISGERKRTGGLSEWIRLHFLAKIGKRQIMTFCRQISVLIDVGMPLLEALRTLENRTSDSRLRRVIEELGDSVEQGESFSSSLSKFPRLFSSFFVNMVIVAERGGSLDKSLRMLANHLEKEDLIRAKVRRALIYPAMTIAVGLVVVMLVLSIVIPSFATLYQGENVKLPLPTRILIGAGWFFKTFWFPLLLVIALIVLGFRYYSRTTGGQMILDRLKLRLPLFGDLLTKIHVGQFCQTLGSLLQGGVPILRSLGIVRETIGNQVIAQTMRETSQVVEMGGKIIEPLERAGVFPWLALDLIAVGEEAGQLDAMLLKIADTYQEEVDRTVDNFSSFIEPLLLLVVGLFAALIAYAVFLPYFSLVDVIK